MKSRFDQEVDAILEAVGRAALNVLGAIPMVASGVMPLQTAVSNVSQAYQTSGGTTGTPKTTTSTPKSTAQQQTTTTPAAATPIRNIANFDTKLKNLVDTSNMLPADKAAIKSALQGLKGSSSRQLTNQDVAAIVASLS